MLQELRIKNLAIIDELSLCFSKGLNVLSGETGTGKSIILNAIHLLLGDRAKEEEIRGSAEEAGVEALFDISKHNEIREKVMEKSAKHPEKNEEDFLLVSRVLSRSGRGRAFINGSLATLGMLTEIGEELLSICGQHEHQSLQRVDTHIDILDEFGGLLGLRERFQSVFQEFLSLSEEVNRIHEEREKRTKERALMEFQSKEISDSAIYPGEEEAFKEEKRILAHAQRLMSFASSAEETLFSDEGAAVERMQTVLQQGKELAKIDPSLHEILKMLETSMIQIGEVGIGLRDYGGRLEANPVRLEEIEGRLEEIDRLKRKYGPTIEEVLRFKEKIDEKLRSFTVDEERLDQLEGRLKPLEKEVATLAAELSEERKKAARELKKTIEKELGSLEMKKTRFEVKIDETPLSPKGKDRVEFLISPNVGEEVKPLAKIASGGELSRMMLAMKRILAKAGGREVLIFDEVDSGIGGATAEVVGRKLKELSSQYQVICVTHLPQIACFADTHFIVKKEVKGGRTFSQVERLGKDTVVNEIARMLGGLNVTEKTRAHAKEMLENARKA